MPRAALRVVQKSAFHTQEVELWPQESSKDTHTLHFAMFYPGTPRPELASYFIRRFSKHGDTVLDPFCAGGSVGLEANLGGRIAYFSDNSELAVKIARAKVEPADITEVTLRLQQINFRRPINARLYDEVFAPFYDLDTFRELVNLRYFLHENNDRISRFVELVALSLLHGHSAGYFSVYSFPQISLRPVEQHQLNLKRSQVPDYRAVAPRILRKTATLLRDGITSSFQQMEFGNRFATCDARDLAYIKSATVDLVICAPPSPVVKNVAADQWLKLWFVALSDKMQASYNFGLNQLCGWRDYMNEVLVELARVVKPGGRIVLDLVEVGLQAEQVLLDQELQSLISENLSKYLEPEGVLINAARQTALQESFKERDQQRLRSRNRILVIRRR